MSAAVSRLRPKVSSVLAQISRAYHFRPGRLDPVSSVSTGEPKAIAASLEQFRWNAQKTVEVLGLRKNALHLGSMSQCYTNGLFNSFMLPLLTDGACELGPVVNGLAVRRFIQIVRDFSPQVLWSIRR
jgi:acyl-coenzyme A synthetase/AMP-(fatty) acid ligase